jgi:A/G-specific adenine glycosylase
MLQQTQVATVLPYYQRFMKAFPTVHALQRAPIGQVLALWSGLGYYRRAENLKKSARIIAARHGGRLPENYAHLRALPGIGDYTAGAILSIAFGKSLPALDGNARRVLARLFLVADEKTLRNTAERLVSRTRPGPFNQSLMELGSVVCTPTHPRCPECPVKSLCAAQKSQPFTDNRLVKKRPASRSVTWPLAIVRSNGRLLLRRRLDGGVLAGLWELPGGEKTRRGSPRALLRQCLGQDRALAARAQKLGEVSHSITNRRIRAPVFLIELPPADTARFAGPPWRWVAPAALRRQPTSAMTRKALTLLVDHEASCL